MVDGLLFCQIGRAYRDIADVIFHYWKLDVQNVMRRLRVHSNISNPNINNSQESHQRHNYPNKGNEMGDVAIQYFERAIKMNCSTGYVELSRVWSGSCIGVKKDHNKAISYLLEALKKGIWDEKLIIALLSLPDNVTLEEGEGESISLLKCETYNQMIIHLCHEMIRLGIPLGYETLASRYHYGYGGLQSDDAKSLALWTEADRLGLATGGVYKRLTAAMGYVTYALTYLAIPLSLEYYVHYSIILPFRH